MTFEVVAISEVDDDVVALLTIALDDLAGHRGGVRLRDEITAAVGFDQSADIVARLCSDQRLITATVAGATVGLLALSVQGPSTILGIYVAHANRRQTIGRCLVTVALALTDAPLDAWVLPGDRATKSLYEQAGWKARRLTMSAG